MSSVNFDRAAGFYDQTRPLSPELEAFGLPAILDWAGPGGRLLEVGVGTGRIAGPLWRQGAQLAGCDIAPAMLARLRAKHPGAPVALGAAGRLPFASARFRVVLTVHVLHLVADWRAALDEFRRVLTPGGAHVVYWYQADPQAPAQRLRQHWRSRVVDRGGAWRRPGVSGPEELTQAVTALGGQLARRLDLPGERAPYTAREVLGAIARRTYSDAWDVPEAIHAASLLETEAFARAEYGDLDRPQSEAGGRAWLDFFAFA